VGPGALAAYRVPAPHYEGVGGAGLELGEGDADGEGDGGDVPDPPPEGVAPPVVEELVVGDGPVVPRVGPVDLEAAGAPREAQHRHRQRLLRCHSGGQRWQAPLLTLRPQTFSFPRIISFIRFFNKFV